MFRMFPLIMEAMNEITNNTAKDNFTFHEFFIAVLS